MRTILNNVLESVNPTGLKIGGDGEFHAPLGPFDLHLLFGEETQESNILHVQPLGAFDVLAEAIQAATDLLKREQGAGPDRKLIVSDASGYRCFESMIL